MISSPEQAMSRVMQWKDNETPLTMSFGGFGIGLQASDVLVSPESSPEGLRLADRSGSFSLTFKLRGYNLKPSEGPGGKPCVEVAFAKEVWMVLCER
ncbi:MAG: hypothetical protein ABSH28_24620 [Acidobacteriota bacterium]|jgi:hypothetical protein